MPAKTAATKATKQDTNRTDYAVTLQKSLENRAAKDIHQKRSGHPEKLPNSSKKEQKTDQEKRRLAESTKHRVLKFHRNHVPVSLSVPDPLCYSVRSREIGHRSGLPITALLQ
tara:strand:- start:31 stop:369 length:339 start_codon:yes stop_codon:yes gene_type:complete